MHRVRRCQTVNTPHAGRVSHITLRKHTLVLFIVSGIGLLAILSQSVQYCVSGVGCTLVENNVCKGGVPDSAELCPALSLPTPTLRLQSDLAHGDLH